ncbi:hypothetical protein JCM13304A_16040 [Desulfothermus okinawensis JCM 13304]
MYISREKLLHLSLNQLTPGKLMDQLKFCPEIFNFLKSKENSLGRIRPIVTYTICLSIMAYRQTSESKRDIPSGFFEALWRKFSSNKKVAKLPGDIIEDLEPELWNFFLNILKKERLRDDNIKNEEIGTGALVFSIVVMGLLYIFGQENTMEKLSHLIG